MVDFVLEYARGRLPPTRERKDADSDEAARV